MRIPRLPMNAFVTGLLAGMAWTVLIGPVFSDDSPKRSSASQIDKSVASLIEQLGSENFRVRSNAMAALERIGLPAFQQLRQALSHTNAQIVLSAEYLLLSQNVVWWLDTDSHEVRERLQDYSSLKSLERHTRLQELGRLGSDDAFQALCRISKFESSEWVSRAAALSLLDQVCKLDADRQATIARSILLTVDQADRQSTQWLAAYANQVLSDQPIDFAIWTGFADNLVSSLPDAGKLRNEQRLQVLQYYEWLTRWASDYQERQATLDMLKPSLRLVDESAFAVREYCNWALSVKLPELVAELASLQPTLFESDPELCYLLAESHLHAGNQSKAGELAARALQLPNDRTKQFGQLGRRTAAEMDIVQRSSQAFRLESRGLFDWAEAELLEALKLDSQGQQFARINVIRNQLASLYWSGGEYEKAAEAIKPAAESEPIDEDLPGGSFDHPSLVAAYHWYRALYAVSQGQLDTARELLRDALEANRTADEQNPDILISFYQHAVSSEDRERFQIEFDAVVKRLRTRIAVEESHLAASNLGPFANAGEDLAMYCNQLAWLLSNCEANIEESLYLIRRSLEFKPDNAAYLDTMARCCYAAGKLDDAIRFQREALKKAPHDRQMKKQLAEFEKKQAETSHGK